VQSSIVGNSAEIRAILDLDRRVGYICRTYERRLITSALPYVNNVPHLGNSSRCCQRTCSRATAGLAGYETLYICGTTSTGPPPRPRRWRRALPRGSSATATTPSTATSTPGSTSPSTSSAAPRCPCTPRSPSTSSSSCTRRLHQRAGAESALLREGPAVPGGPLRAGHLPHCGSLEARGDQCENCGKLLDPTELIDPRCSLCSTKPVIRETKHLFIDCWPSCRSCATGLKERRTRVLGAQRGADDLRVDARRLEGALHHADLKWGIPVPLDGYRNKVFYVWFDACIGYISITAEHTPEWKGWWYAQMQSGCSSHRQGQHPFHTVISRPVSWARGSDGHAAPHVLHRIPQLRGGKFPRAGHRRIRHGCQGNGYLGGRLGVSTSITTGPRSRTPFSRGRTSRKR